MAENEKHKEINRAIRAGFGQRVGGHVPDEVSSAVNSFIRAEAARGTVEADVESGKVTHRDGREV